MSWLSKIFFANINTDNDYIMVAYFSQHHKKVFIISSSYTHYMIQIRHKPLKSCSFFLKFIEIL